MEARDCSHMLEERDPSRMLIKILVISQHQVTKDDVDRQLRIINQYSFVSKNGFLVRDLSNVMNLFEYVQQRLLTEPMFEEPLNKLLDLCLIPPVLTKSSEVLQFAMDLQEYFSWFGYMLVWLNKNKYQKKIIDAIYSLLTKECSERNYVTLSVRKAKASASKLAVLLGEILEIAEDYIYLDLLRVVEVLIKGSKQTSISLLKKNAVSTIIARLEPTWRNRFPLKKPAVPLGTEEILGTKTIFYILTSLLNHANTTTMRAPSKFALWSLQWAFRLFAMKETTNVERNNILAVVLLLLDIYPNVLMGNMTFSYDLAVLALSRDIIFSENWVSDVHLRTSDEDHSCLALLLMCISYFPNCISGSGVIEKCRVITGLLKLVSGQQAIEWQFLQSCHLIRVAINVLHKITPAATEDFIEDGGPLIFIQLLSRYIKNYEIILRSLDLLVLLSKKDESVRSSLAYNGGVTCILNVCKVYLASEYLSEENQAILIAGFCLLQLISNHDDACEVLPLVVSYMKQYIQPGQIQSVQNPKLIIICLSFIWSNVISSSVNSKKFVDLNGVYLILDIVHIGCLPVKLVALGALIDLCETVECIPYLITWKKNGKGIRGLLMEVFRQENKQLNVKTNEHGIMLNYAYPLMGEKQYYETYCMCEKHTGNAAIADMFISCRPKVYCLLQILDHKQHETVEIANEVYKTYSEKLSAVDEVTYVIAENFLALKLGEEWKEIMQDLKKINLEPIPSDAAALDAMVTMSNKWAHDLLEKQLDILKKHHIRREKREEALYQKLRNACLADAWDALCEMKYIARCSERLFRVMNNFSQESQIRQSLQQVDEVNGPLHRTFQTNLSVSCVNNQHICIPKETCGDSLVNTNKPVIFSPATSEMNSPRVPCGEPQGDYLPEEI